MIDKMEIQIPPPPTPVIARPKIRKFTERATAQKRLPSSKTAIEVRRTGFAAEIVRSLPKKSMKDAWIVSFESEYPGS
jgi:hypothetical protein